MARVAYERRKFQRRTQEIIDKANQIGEEYSDQGLNLTLRQIHYQFVARDWYENTQRNYKKLGDVLRNARMAGEMDWDLMVDRTRSLYGRNTFISPRHAILDMLSSYYEDLWDDQPFRVEVWIEKNALSQVVSQATREYQVDYFPTVGYPSISSLKRAADRIRRHEQNDKDVVILHLSDHDPEGFNMADQIRDQLHQMGTNVHVKRIGLTMEQIQKFNPPPSFAKESSSRYWSYVEEQGTDQAWELDALEPNVIIDLLNEEIESYIDWEIWEERKEEFEDNKRQIRKIAEEF